MGSKIAGLIAANPVLGAWLLCAAPGIDLRVQATLLGWLPELGALRRRRIASLAPHAWEGETWHGDCGRPVLSFGIFPAGAEL